MKLVVSFICGALFGAFVIINLWQPNLGQKKTEKKSADVKIKRFDKDFDIKDMKKRADRRRKNGDALNDDLKDMQKQMQQALKDTGSIFKMMENTIQAGAAGAVGTNVGEIVEKYTNDSVILELDITNIDNSTLDIEVKDNQVHISGEARIERTEGGSQRVMVTSFSRSHPVPEGTKGDRLQVESKGKNRIQLIFPKVK